MKSEYLRVVHPSTMASPSTNKHRMACKMPQNPYAPLATITLNIESSMWLFLLHSVLPPLLHVLQRECQVIEILEHISTICHQCPSYTSVQLLQKHQSHRPTIYFYIVQNILPGLCPQLKIGLYQKNYHLRYISKIFSASRNPSSKLVGSSPISILER